MSPILSWNLPAEPVKKTFPPDFTIFKTWVCSGDNVTGSGSPDTGSSTRLGGSSLGAGAEGSEAVGICLSSWSGSRIGSRRSVEYLTQILGLGVLEREGFIHSCASARLWKDLCLFPGYLFTCRAVSPFVRSA